MWAISCISFLLRPVDSGARYDALRAQNQEHGPVRSQDFPLAMLRLRPALHRNGGNTIKKIGRVVLVREGRRGHSHAKEIA